MILERFSTFLADTAEAQSLHHNLRYRVYCERKGFEEGAVINAVPQERDDYDAAASRFIVKDNVTDNWIGTARLVLNEEAPLPAQSLGAIDRQFHHLFDGALAAEVSRLTAVETSQSLKLTGELLQNVIIGALDYSKDRNIDWLVFLICPSLARILKRIGVPMEECGPEIEHRGVRRAFRSNVAEAIQHIPWLTPVRAGIPGYALFSSLRFAEAA